MGGKLRVGPLLGLESDRLYTFCFLTEKSAQSAAIRIGTEEHPASLMGETPRGRFWRAEVAFEPQAHSRPISYRIELNGHQARDAQGRDGWTFSVPGTEEEPLLAYTSCNGFSSFDLRNKTEDPYRLWRELSERHARTPYTLLLMGGDQLYADAIWTEVPALRAWGELSRGDKVRTAVEPELTRQVEYFYERLYQERWSDPQMSLMLASIPSAMMWDDHDIFDGWGSYPEDLQNCPVYQAIFSVARRYFELFQVRSRSNRSLLDAEAGHYAFALEFHGRQILALDNRSERSLTQVMSPQQWDAVNRYLATRAQSGDLLVLSAVPVVYRDFSFAESALDMTPWDEELTDDLKDHWRAKEHQGERARLIMRLLENASARRANTPGARTLLLSGDVHLGCLGVINDQRQHAITKIHQIVSSGIVHPAPSRIEWTGIMAVTNDHDEYLNEDRTIRISMLSPFGSDKYIRSRNFVTLQQGSDRKLWVNWICEQKDNPCYPLD